MLILSLLLLPLIGAGWLILLPSQRKHFCPHFSIGITGLSLITLGILTWRWSQVGTLSFRAEWLPAFGLDFSFWLDGPALFYSWLILGIGFLVLQYSLYYMKPNDSPRRFYASILAFLASMLGIVLARNLILTFLFWEMTSLTSFLLIGHWNQKKAAIAGAQRALLITGMGGLCFLVGAALVQNILNDIAPESRLEWDALWELGVAITQHPLGTFVLILFLLAAFTKSAQFPFHFWLPGAMEAPTPVSALLHAATMVKAGVFLIGRLYPIFNTELLWVLLVGATGVITMLVGGYLAIFSKDIKQLLAYSTVSQLGLLIAYYGFGYQGLGGENLLKIDLLLVASHALFKCALFMLCGIVDHEAGTRDRRELGGLWRRMPVSATLSVLACLSMAGMPFTLGFVAKKIFLEASLKLDSPILYFEELLFVLATVASAFTVCYCLQFVVATFFGEPKNSKVFERSHEGPVGMLIAPALLTAICILGGLYVPVIEEPLSYLAPAYVKTETGFILAFFQHPDFLFWTSMAVFLFGGPVLFLLSPQLDRWHDRIGRAPSASAFSDNAFQDWIPAFAERVTRFIQSPAIERNLAIIFGLIIFMCGFPLARGAEFATPNSSWSLFEWIAALNVLIVLILVGIVLTVKRLITRLLALGFIGLAIAFYFVLYMAPDLAITQVLVELVLLLMFLNLLDHFSKVETGDSHTRQTLWKGGLAVGLGLLMGAFTYTMANSQLRWTPLLEGNPTHADYYLQNAKYPAEEGGHSGGGRNVVNVILVDFRAMDTLGEIAVLAVAALGVIVLGRKRSLRGKRKMESAGDAGDGGSQEPVVFLRVGEPNILRGTAPLVTVLTLAFAGVLFFAGHNRPGGGFIAGLAGCVAAVPFGLRPGGPPSRFSLIPHSLTVEGLGLLTAIGTGLAAVFLGYPFLRSAHREIVLPVVGSTELASALVFDFGIFLTVLGVAATMLRTMTHEPAEE